MYKPKQVTSLEISKRLKQLGVKQESLFVWSKQEDLVHWKCEYRQYFAVDMRRDIAAFTVAELGELLPEHKQHPLRFIQTHKAPDGEWTVKYVGSENCNIGFTKDIQRFFGTEAEARGKMLIYLLENKWVHNN